MPGFGRLNRCFRGYRNAGVADGERLLDLACGPGRIPPAAWRHRSPRCGPSIELKCPDHGRGGRPRPPSMRWRVGKAEELTAPGQSFDLITIGEAFHRLESRRVAAQSLRWLKPGGGGATPSCPDRRHPDRQRALPTDRCRPHATLDAPGLPERVGLVAERDRRRPRARTVLREADEAVASRDFVRTQEWTIEAIIGDLDSTSVCSRRILGDRADAFEGDLTAALLAHDASGGYGQAMARIHVGQKAGLGEPIGRDAAIVARRRSCAEKRLKLLTTLTDTKPPHSPGRRYRTPRRADPRRPRDL